MLGSVWLGLGVMPGVSQSLAGATPECPGLGRVTAAQEQRRVLSQRKEFQVGLSTCPLHWAPPGRPDRPAVLSPQLSLGLPQPAPAPVFHPWGPDPEHVGGEPPGRAAARGAGPALGAAAPG